MEWFKWYPALYEADTEHLTAEQDGIYRRLIDRYMRTRQPLPDNDNALSRIAGVSLDSWCHASVKPFFKPDQGKLFHSFCDKQLAEQDETTRTKSVIGKICAEKRWKKIKQNQQPNGSSYSKGIADPMQEEKRGEEKTVIVLLDWLPVDLWNEFIALRKQLKKPATDRAKQLLIKDLEKLKGQGHTPQSIIELAIKNSWQGFYAPKEANGNFKKPEAPLWKHLPKLYAHGIQTGPTIYHYHNQSCDQTYCIRSLIRSFEGRLERSDPILYVHKEAPY